MLPIYILVSQPQGEGAGGEKASRAREAGITRFQERREGEASARLLRGLRPAPGT